MSIRYLYKYQATKHFVNLNSILKHIVFASLKVKTVLKNDVSDTKVECYILIRSVMFRVKFT